MFFRYDRAPRTMKAGAIDQPGLERLELLAGNDMIVNIDNHDEILSIRNGSYLSESDDAQQDGRRLG
jgi:hypothetical protein